MSTTDEFLNLLKEKREEYWGHGGYEGGLKRNGDVLETNCSHCGSVFQVRFKVVNLIPLQVQFLDSRYEAMKALGCPVEEPKIETYDSLIRLKQNIEEMMAGA